MFKRVAVVIAVAMAMSFADTQRAAAAAIYASEATFITDSGALSFESFEGLTATNSVAPGFLATLAHFTLAASPTGGVFNLADYAGTHATHGVNYVEVEGGTQQVLTFTFTAPIKELGLTITDYGDVIPGASQLTFLTNTGVSGTAVTGPRPNANDQFFGLIDVTPFTSIAFTTPVGPFGDPFSVDRVYYTQRTGAVPEPTLVALLGIGIAGACGVRRTRRNQGRISNLTD